MKLLVGLGNPGKEYEKSRHNVGFIFVDALAKRLAKESDAFNVVWKFEKKVKCNIARFDDVILAKPQTFMNLSGEAVLLLLNYYKCDMSDLIVVHDDIDLKQKEIRFKRNMGSGGHNGVKDVIEKVGTKDFFRLRVGVDRPNIESVKDYVLSNLTTEEISFINSLAGGFEV